MAYKAKVPRPKCERFFYVVTVVFIVSLFLYLLNTQGVIDVASIDGSSISFKCPTSHIRAPQTETKTRGVYGDDINYALTIKAPVLESSCLDPDGPLPVIVMSLGRSGTDSTWQILQTLTNTKMKAIEIVGGYEDEMVAFFRVLDGVKEAPASWAAEKDWDWRAIGGGTKAMHGFYDHIQDFCSDGNCKDGRWIFKWFCDEQQRHRSDGGLVGFKWKAYMSALRSESAHNAFKIVAQLGVSNTPIRVIRSRRNPLDVYLSELKHSTTKENLPDHCGEGDDECFRKHAAIRLVVPVKKMYEWVHNTYEEENEVDALLSEMGVRTVHVQYDNLYYARTEEEGLKEWLRIFRFLDQPADYEWSDIAGAAGLKPTTKSRSHKVLIDNFQEVYAILKDTKLEQFVRIE